MGSVKQIPIEVSRKAHKCHNSTRILQNRSDRRTDLKTFRNWKSRTFSGAVVTSQSEYFTVKRVTEKPICSLSWSSREDWPTDLCQKFPNLTTRAVRSKEYDRTEGHNFYLGETIPNSEQNLVYWAIWRTMNLIQPFIRPRKQICDREQTPTAYLFIAMSVWRDTCTR